MSVRVNDRHLSDIEYENTFSIFNQYATSKIRHLPRRYKHFLGEPFSNILNEIYEEIIKMTSLYLSGKPSSIERYRLGTEILKKFEVIASLSYTMWNLSSDRNNEVKYIKPKAREFWTDLANKEMSLIIGVIKKCNGYKKNGAVIPYMKAFSNAQIKEVVFLSKLSKLQRIIYKIAIQTSKDYRDAQIEMIVKLSRSAFYNAYIGNEIFISDEYTYNRRKKLFSEAINNLYAMNRPVMELSCVDVFSEKDLKDICNLVTDSMKILKTIKDLDESKYLELSK